MEHLLTSISSLAQNHGLPVLLIGGHAVTALGHPRATFDVDLLVPRSSAPRWREPLRRLRYQVFGESEHFVQFESHPDWPLPPIDLMLVDDAVFEALFRERSTQEPISTPSVLGLIALKLHAIKQPSRINTQQDWADVLALVDVHELRLDDPSFDGIIRKHGGDKAIERIQAHLAGRDHS